MASHRGGPGLRTKLFVVSLTLLAVPWAAYRYVGEMERFLRENQEQTLLATAQTVAALLRDRPALFERHSARLAGVAEQHIHPVRTTEAAPIVDGYPEEWRGRLDLARRFEAGSVAVDHLSVLHGEHLYLLFSVTDDRLVYRDPTRAEPDGDHLILHLGEHDYLLSTSAPGRVNAYRLRADGELHWEPSVRGEWQESADGYTLEIRLPLALAEQGFGFTLVDVDESDGAAAGRIESRGTLLLPDAAIELLLREMGRGLGRIWVVDGAGRVLAVGGELTGAHREEGEGAGLLLELLHRLVITPPGFDAEDPTRRAVRLTGEDTLSALRGQPASRRRSGSDGGAVIVSASYPIELESGVAGAVVVEQSANAVLAVQNRAIRQLFNTTVPAFAGALVILLLFATRLSLRVRRLRDQAEAAIGPDGRVRGAVADTRSGDEIGDLSRAVSAMLGRLGQYNRYLETMAGKLSHELRTPLAVVRSSLDNLASVDSEPERARYLARAREGVERLGGILSRLSEATRLEQALRQTELETLPLDQLVRACVEGYRIAHPHERFELELGGAPLAVRAAPDLIAQMFDKLVDNAIGFRAPGTPIRIGLRRSGDHILLSVGNQGPLLPAEMPDRLFDSMVSVRARKEERPHLGLGLYIVRLIADFHGGEARARNRPAGDGVEFTIRLPWSERSGTDLFRPYSGQR